LSKEDEELSRLIIKYNKSLETHPRQEPAKENATSTWKNLWVKSTSTRTTASDRSIPGPFTAPSPDEVIQGKSITYTRAEAQQYANEEPCDSWRHIDVHFPPPPPNPLNERIGVNTPSLPPSRRIRLLSLWLPKKSRSILQGTAILYGDKVNGSTGGKDCHWTAQEGQGGKVT
jgi:hypothetical protein